MLCGDKVIELNQALTIISAVVKPITSIEERSLSEALHAVIGQDIFAPYALPPFDNSAIDGYAFRHADIGATKTLSIIGEAAAGKPFSGEELPPKSAVRISTGGMIPPQCDTVVMQEVCKIESEQLTLSDIPSLGSSIRRAGNDIQASALALKSGQRLRPQDIAFLHALGMKNIPVKPRLRIAIISTGLELRSTGSSLGSSQIIDTNGLMLLQLLQNLDADVSLLPSLPDDYEETLAFIKKTSADHDIIITTGGVSVGGHDYVRDVMHQEGKVFFWKIAMKPGRPVLFGQFSNCFMACLPGNPVSAMVTFFLIVRPLLDALLGRTPVLTPAYMVPLGEPINKEEHLRVFPRAMIKRTDQGLYYAHPYHDQTSNLLSSLSSADGLLDLPIGSTHFKKGELVAYRPFHGLI